MKTKLTILTLILVLLLSTYSQSQPNSMFNTHSTDSQPGTTVPTQNQPNYPSNHKPPPSPSAFPQMPMNLNQAQNRTLQEKPNPVSNLMRGEGLSRKGPMPTPFH